MGEDTNIYIADLPSNVDEEALQKAFNKYGTVVWHRIMPSKGQETTAAIVEYQDISEAKWVVENMNGAQPDGISAPLTITFKREKRRKGDGKGSWGKSDKGKGKGDAKGGWGKSDGKSFGGKDKGKGDNGWGKGGKDKGKSDNGWGKGGNGWSSSGKGNSPYDNGKGSGKGK